MDDLSTVTVPGPSHSQTFPKQINGSGEGREVLGHYLGTGGLKPWPCLRQRTKKRPSCFKAIYWQLQHNKFTSKSRLLCTWSTNKFHLENQIDRAWCRQYPADRLTRNYTPCLGQAHKKLYIPCLRGQKQYPVQRHIPALIPAQAQKGNKLTPPHPSRGKSKLNYKKPEPITSFSRGVIFTLLSLRKTWEYS